MITARWIDTCTVTPLPFEDHLSSQAHQIDTPFYIQGVWFTYYILGSVITRCSISKINIKYWERVAFSWMWLMCACLIIRSSENFDKIPNTQYSTATAQRECCTCLGFLLEQTAFLEWVMSIQCIVSSEYSTWNVTVCECLNRNWNARCLLYNLLPLSNWGTIVSVHHMRLTKFNWKKQTYADTNQLCNDNRRYAKMAHSRMF